MNNHLIIIYALLAIDLVLLTCIVILELRTREYAKEYTMVTLRNKILETASKDAYSLLQETVSGIQTLKDEIDRRSIDTINRVESLEEKMKLVLPKRSMEPK